MRLGDRPNFYRTVSRTILDLKENTMELIVKEMEDAIHFLECFRKRNYEIIMNHRHTMKERIHADYIPRMHEIIDSFDPICEDRKE